MKLTIMCVRDRALPSFGTPFFQTHIGQAIRSFQDEINNKDGKSPLSAHPEDFDLYHLGFYYDDNATFELLKDGPKQVAVGKDLVKPIN